MFKKLKKFELTLILILILVYVLSYYIAATQKVYFESVFAMEDGPLEYATVLALLSGCFLFLKRFINLKNYKPILFKISLLAMAFIFFFGAGEELSWGMRLIGLDLSNTPEFFIKNNSQYEVNFHNLQFNGYKLNKIIFGKLLSFCVLIYFLILPFAFDKSKKIQSLVNKFAVPIPQKYYIFIALGWFLLVELIPSGKRGELRELGLCFIAYLVVLYPANKEVYQIS